MTRPAPPPRGPRPPAGRAALRDQRGFVLVFDHRFVFRDIPGGVRLEAECPDCRRRVTLVERQPYRQFILSWIPLWKVRRGDTCLECPACHSRFEVPDEMRPRRAATPDGDDDEPEGPSL